MNDQVEAKQTDVETLALAICGNATLDSAIISKAEYVLIQCLDRRLTELEKLDPNTDGGGCTLTAPGRGDCEHAVGLPGKLIPPGQHDGADITVDAYGKPNGWCWSCWKNHQIRLLRAELAKAEKVTYISHG